MNWTVEYGNIVDEPADVLICSANVFLNLSGGVGGEILLRFGQGMQEELHQYLADRRLKFVQRGDVVTTKPHGTHFRSVIHAVAVNGFYESSPEIITDITHQSLVMSARLGAKTVALTALATGYGRLTMQQFASGVFPLKLLEIDPIEQITICVRHEFECDEIRLTMQI